MTAFVACLVCARPLDSLLTGGLHAGVLVMAVVALVVVAAIARGAIRIVKEDAAETAHPHPGAAAGAGPEGAA